MHIFVCVGKPEPQVPAVFPKHKNSSPSLSYQLIVHYFLFIILILKVTHRRGWCGKGVFEECRHRAKAWSFHCHLICHEKQD